MMNWLTASIPLHEAPSHMLEILTGTPLKGMVLLLVAALITACMRRSSAALRHLVWAAAMGGLLLLPVGSLLLPKWQLPILPSPTGTVTSGERPSAPTAASSEAVTSPLITSQREPTAPTVRSEVTAREVSGAVSSPPPTNAVRFPLPILLVTVWLLGTLAALAPLVAGLLGAARLVRNSRPFAWDSLPAQDSRMLAPLAGVHCHVRILRAPDHTMPMATGLLRPVILLPSEAETWSEEERRAVLLHEFAHVRRHDCLVHVVAHVAASLHWFNPMAWLALRRLHVEREQACDDLALNAGQEPSTYASQLLRIASTMHAGALASTAAVTMARKGAVEGRLLAILDATRNRCAVTRSRLAACAALLLTLTCTMALTEASSSVRRDADKAVGIVSKTSLLDKNATERIGEALALVSKHPQNETLPLLAEWLSARDKNERRAAIYIIGELAWDNPEAALKPLRQLLDHSEDKTRGMACLTLSYLQDRASLEKTSKMLQSDPSDYVQRCAAFALGELHDERALPALESAASAGPGMVKENAQNAIARIRWWRETTPDAAGSPKTAKGIWMIAGSTTEQKDRLERATKLVLEDEPVSRTALLRKAFRFDAEGQFFFFGAYLEATKRLNQSVGSPTRPKTSLVFPDGVTIDLFGVAEKKWSEYLPGWWYPDGKRGTTLPKNLAEQGNRQIHAFRTTPQPGDQPIAFAFEIRRPDGGETRNWDFTLDANGKRLDSRPGGRTASNRDSTGVGYGFIGTSLPSDATTCTLRIGVPAGEWKTVGVYDCAQKVFTKQDEPSLQVRAVDGNGDQSTRLRYVHTVVDREIEVVAIKTDGKPIQRDGYGNRQTTLFSNFQVPSHEIARFEFRTRDLEWACFRNVSLVPDLMTTVDAVAETTSHP